MSFLFCSSLKNVKFQRIFRLNNHNPFHYNNVLLTQTHLFCSSEFDRDRKFKEKYNKNEDETDLLDDELDTGISQKDELKTQTQKRREWLKGQSTKTVSQDIKQKDPTRWNKIKGVFAKPFSIFKKSSKDTPTDKTSKSKIKKSSIDRPDKKGLPSPDEGIMTYIPKHKSEILNILQEECQIYPDEVFPLFPDPKTETILAAAQITEGDSKPLQFVDDNIDAKVFISEDMVERDVKSVEDTSGDDIGMIEGKSDELMVVDKDLVKIGSKKIKIEDYLEDNYTKKLTPTQKRNLKITGMNVDLRGDQRDLDPFGPFKTTKVLTPDEVLELSQRKDDDGEIMVSDKDTNSHAIWSQEPDNIYEIIQVLSEAGFKADQTNDVWPYTEFNRGDDSDFGYSNEYVNRDDNGNTNESTQTDIVKLSALNPVPDKFNDFYLLFSRYPEILTMELNDLRRKISTLNEFDINDIRTILIKDPRILRRPSHHIRLMLELLDDYYVDNYEEIVEFSPYFLSSTSKNELKKRINFIYENIIKKGKALSDKRNKVIHKQFRNKLLDITRSSSFYIDNGKVIQDGTDGSEHSEQTKKEISSFISKYPGIIGNSSSLRMNLIKQLLKKHVGLNNTELTDILTEYPQIITLDPEYFKIYLFELKKNGISIYDIKSVMMSKIHDILQYSESNSFQLKLLRKEQLLS